MKFKKLLFTSFIINFSVYTLLAQNQNITFRSQLTYPGQTCANICGYVDSLGNEYALVGASVGLSIVDVTNPSNPVKVYQHTGPTGTQAEWQEIKVRGKFAYVTTEAGGGLQIFNLSTLPNVAGITTHSWTGDGAIAGQLTSIHSLHIDNNFVYLYGSKLFGGGAIVADLTNPWTPTYAGKYSVGTGNAPYVHDGYVRNDTLFASHIYKGYFSIVDFRDKANPIELNNQFTPNNFTHNTWLSTNSKTLFTTDEITNSFLTSYDVSDPSNINELDKIQSNAGSGSIVHNTHIINVNGNDFAVTSWYRDGFTITDVSRPQNMIQVGNYDTYPTANGNGFNGDWGVYPYLPSGTIIVSNIEDGLFVFSPTYIHACYLEGSVTDSICGAQLNNTKITCISANIKDSTDISGEYKTGTYLPGTYDITFSKTGYLSKTITGVLLSAGVVNNLNIQLVPLNTVNVIGVTSDASTGNPLSDASVTINNSLSSYNFVTDNNGNFSSCNLLTANDYNIYAGKWGYETYCSSNQTINQSTSNLSYQLSKGYYDDFTFDFGWSVNSTASSGIWERGVPLGTNSGLTLINPGVDESIDCSNKAYVTGNTGLTSSDQDVDNGATTLTSPLFDLSNYSIPYIDYSRWFYNGGGSGSPNDSLSIYLYNGISTVLLEYVVVSSAGNSSWVHKSFKISDYILPTSTMQLIVRVADNLPGHILEAGFDSFFIQEGASSIVEQVNKIDNLINVFPNPFTEQISIAYELKNKLADNSAIIIADIAGRVISEIKVTQKKSVLLVTPELNSGIYSVMIINGSEKSTPIKIVKMN